MLTSIGLSSLTMSRRRRGLCAVLLQLMLPLSAMAGVDVFGSYFELPQVLFRGQAATVTFEVTNDGDDWIWSSLYGTFFISTDATITTSDQAVGSGFQLEAVWPFKPPAPNGGKTRALYDQFYVPWNLPLGSYTAGMIVDCDLLADEYRSTIAETDETNNANRGFGLDKQSFRVVGGTHVLCIGSTDNSGDELLEGGMDATEVFNAVSRLAGSPNANREILRYEYHDKTKSPKQDVMSKLAYMVDPANPSAVRAGDTIVFYYSGHGFGEGSKASDGRIATGVDERLLITVTQTEDPLCNYRITDDELTAMFADPRWAGINKLFVIDTCHAAGFGESFDDTGDENDLLSLPQAAILAACGEYDLSAAQGDGRSALSKAFADAITLGGDGFCKADLDHNGVTFGELAAYIPDVLAIPGSYSGVLRDDYGDPSFEATIGVGTGSFFCRQSSDFDMIIGVPEPATLSLLALGALAVIHRGRR